MGTTIKMKTTTKLVTRFTILTSFSTLAAFNANPQNNSANNTGAYRNLAQEIGKTNLISKQTPPSDTSLIRDV
jgi:oligosaccharide reducing-end xylanase